VEPRKEEHHDRIMMMMMMMMMMIIIIIIIRDTRIGNRYFSFYHHVQNGSEAPYLMGTGEGIKLKKHEASPSISWRSLEYMDFIPKTLRRCNQKFPDWPPGARTANGTALCH
jgi:hypothetical protein